MGLFDSLVSAAGKAATYGTHKLKETSDTMYSSQNRASEWSDERLERELLHGGGSAAQKAGYMKEYKNRHGE